ncbi:hypothetical protein [Desulfosporosinus sp. FKA]|uniref:hypothetical protein n=1 Tax=Desulfosporosinus sp. FKA TaxID=1969834 RepID=UPI001552D3E1|nr:hypothetical protein [Desulfosporosinus sp. FKA]
MKTVRKQNTNSQKDAYAETENRDLRNEQINLNPMNLLDQSICLKGLKINDNDGPHDDKEPFNDYQSFSESEGNRKESSSQQTQKPSEFITFESTDSIESSRIELINVLKERKPVEEVEALEEPIMETEVPEEPVEEVEALEEPIMETEVPEEPVEEVEALEEPIMETEVSEEPVEEVEALEEPIMETEVPEEPVEEVEALEEPIMETEVPEEPVEEVEALEELIMETEVSEKSVMEEEIPKEANSDEHLDQLTLDELLNLGFNEKFAGNFAQAAVYFLQALCLEPKPDIAFYLILDCYWLWKNIGESYYAISRIMGYAQKYRPQFSSDLQFQFEVWLKKEDLEKYLY